MNRTKLRKIDAAVHPTPSPKIRSWEVYQVKQDYTKIPFFDKYIKNQNALILLFFFN